MIFPRFILLGSLVLVACQPATITTTPSLSSTTASPTGTPTILPPTLTEAPTSIPTIPDSIVELNGAEVQPGFSLIKFADLYRPTSFAFDTQGKMYVTSQDGNVYILQDENNDGRSDSRFTFATGFYFPLGVTVHKPTGDVYVSHQGKITVLRDTDNDNRADVQKVFADNLPFELHQNDNLKFGPDGWLYIGVGSTCNACDDPDPRSASILRFNVDTGESEIYATGFRNPFDVAFYPPTGELFATDNGRDDLGMDAPFEELNHILRGGDYGYPDCWNEQDMSGCENSIPAAAFFESHSSANGLDFYIGEKFPAEYRNNAFISIFGSWLKPNVQTGISRVILTSDGNTYKGETSWFVRFPAGVMPLPLLFGPDDALYIGDYINDAIYRISYGMP
ncbi:MAG: PQQ-dependent sugar dehydrogenase [Anaerolineae bacterium]|nr:PQQ-dependent sugar dehydrogenase [Anaerolineae bacterium]MCI0608445.1 PQQ-dependent sugar dehydrogenase [Anaerolineae bacterium]